MLSATSPGLGVSGCGKGWGAYGTYTARGPALDGWGGGLGIGRACHVPRYTYPL